MIVMSALIVCALMAGILASFEIGYRVGNYRWTGIPESSRKVSGTLEASVFGLMGLLIAFIFYGAASRFDIRRDLMVQEANAIDTAYLRLDLLPSEVQPQLREDLRTYLRSRLAIYQKISSFPDVHGTIPDIEDVKPAIARSADLQKRIWMDAVAATQTINPAAQSMILSSLNEMIDITTPQTVALTTHLPGPVFEMLFLTVAISSILAGYSMAVYGVRDWVPIITFVVVLGTAVYVILDYEYPRMGFIRVDPVDRVLVEALEEMK